MYIQKQDIFGGNGYHDWKLSSLAITAKSLITMIGLFQIIFSIFKQSYNVDLLSDFNNHKVHFLAFWTHVTPGFDALSYKIKDFNVYIVPPVCWVSISCNKPYVSSRSRDMTPLLDGTI